MSRIGALTIQILGETGRERKNDRPCKEDFLASRCRGVWFVGPVKKNKHYIFAARGFGLRYFLFLVLSHP